MLMKKEVNGLSPPGIFLYGDAFYGDAANLLI